MGQKKFGSKKIWVKKIFGQKICGAGVRGPPPPSDPAPTGSKRENGGAKTKKLQQPSIKNFVNSYGRNENKTEIVKNIDKPMKKRPIKQKKEISNDDVVKKRRGYWIELAKNARRNADANAKDLKTNVTREKGENVTAGFHKEFDLMQNGGDQVNPTNPVLTYRLNSIRQIDVSNQTRESELVGKFEFEPGITQSECDICSEEV